VLCGWVPAAQARLRQASPVASPPSTPREMPLSLQGALQIKAIFLKKNWTNHLCFAPKRRTQNGIRIGARVAEIREWCLIRFGQKS
jgi:hypothetical protein